MVGKWVSLFVVLFVGPAWSGSGQLVVAATEWAPYSGTELLNKGFSPELFSVAMSRKSYEVDVVILPWSRALKGTYDGTFDALLDVWYSDERARKMVFSKPYMTNRIKFIKRVDSNIVSTDFADLRHYEIGVVRDYAYEPQFDMSPVLKKSPERTFLVNLYKLVKHRIDLTLEDEFVARFEIAHKAPELQSLVSFLPDPLSENNLYVGFSKNNEHVKTVVTDFDDSLRSLILDGTYERLKAKHGILWRWDYQP
ncbi:substrate-binding periplasmic protein [Zooshikella ganghwensis]|uniref:substrate-binding periplasmic protein n=1 Tax=Zooshikella ganghwensis TaxID=202772 RepID=UPI000424C8EC|nr:transporter substrate-binding domain-containing protein [Zooshikella ganghwensis]